MGGLGRRLLVSAGVGCAMVGVSGGMAPAAAAARVSPGPRVAAARHGG